MSGLSAFGSNGSERGGGGDGEDITFKSIAAAVVDQLSEISYYRNTLGNDLGLLRDAIRNTPVEFTSRELDVEYGPGSRKLIRSARFHLNGSGRCTLIEVNSGRWKTLSLLEKRRLALHEFLGCIGRESTNDYSISGTIYSRTPLLPSLPSEFGLRVHSLSGPDPEPPSTQAATRRAIRMLEGQIATLHLTMRESFRVEVNRQTWENLGQSLLNADRAVQDAMNLSGSLSKGDSLMSVALRLKLSSRLIQVGFLCEQIRKFAVLAGAPISGITDAEKEEMELYVHEAIERMSGDLVLLHQQIDAQPSGSVSPALLSDIFDLDIWVAFCKDGGLDYLGWSMGVHDTR